jgi:hypothetical protein
VKQVQTQKFIGTVGYMGGVMAVPEPFTWAWGNMLLFTQAAMCGQGENVFPAKSKFSLHDFGRNDLTTRMLGDWIVMLDTDIAFEPDLVARLVTTANKYRLDVLTGMYVYKSPPHYPVLYVHNHETKRDERVADWDRNSEVFQIDSAGGGCLFVRRNVFERITAELCVNAFERIGVKGEDHSFFARLQELKIKAWCAWKIEVQHLEYLGLTPSANFRPEREPDHFFEREGFHEATPA